MIWFLQNYIKTFSTFLENPPLVGVTVFGNGTAGNSLSLLSSPWDITINSDNSMLIVDQNLMRVLRVFENETVGVILVNGTSVVYTRRAIYDDSLQNLFFQRFSKGAMWKCSNGSSNCAKLFGDGSSNSTRTGTSGNFCMNSAGNFYIADTPNHRVLYWPLNSTNNTVIVGTTGMLGNDTLHLYSPQDIALNETQGVIYVDDSLNHRIMRYDIGSPNGTVVAGGNGRGNARK